MVLGIAGVIHIPIGISGAVAGGRAVVSSPVVPAEVGVVAVSVSMSLVGDFVVGVFLFCRV